MRHLKEHYVGQKGHYPGGRFHHSHEDAIDVYDKVGKHVIAFRKNGAGMWEDKSEEQGLPGRHDLQPPKKPVIGGPANPSES